MRQLKVVQMPGLREPIRPSPGFAKKHLADSKLDLMGLCGFGCSYCSSNAGNFLRINRERFADLTEAQLGERLYPATSPDLTFVWPDVLDNLEAQLAKRPPSFGAGQTLVMSMLTDAFSGEALRTGVTRRALELVLARTSFRVRILTKNSTVGLTASWRSFFAENPGRFVVGLSTGSLDAAWAARVEVGCPPPAARVRATQALQDSGVPTFGMLCPIFPDVLEGDGVERLVASIRPERCETVWAEPFNDRSNWAAVRAGYERDSFGWRWFTDVYERRDRRAWSRYATDLYLRIHAIAERDGWSDRLKYLLYEGDVEADDAWRFEGRMGGVLLQGPRHEETGRSRHAVFALLEAARA